MYYFFTFTYLRQMLATSVVWFSIPYAIERKPVKFFALVALAATFHNSALLFFFIYFIADRHFSKQQIYTVFFFSALLGLTPLSSILMENVGGLVNERKAELSVAGSVSQGGVRLAYIIEAIFFIFLVDMMYDRLPQDKKSVCMTNVFLAFLFILIFFARFSDGGRMSWYFMIGPAWVCAELWQLYRTENQYRILMFSVFCFLYFRILTGWSTMLSPYTSFLDKERHMDGVYWSYEYDHKYDVSRFYKW